MFDRFELQFVDGSKYLSATPQVRRGMVPEGAGIYVWTSQLARSFDADDLPATVLLEQLQKGLTTVRELRQDTARVGRYRRVQIFDDPVGLTDASSDRLSTLLTAPRDELSWILLCASLFQRPLYVGKTVNFRNRMRDHFAYKTPFTKLLKKHNISLASCVVTLCPLSLEGASEEEDTEDMDAAVDDAEFEDGGEDTDLISLDEDEEYVPPSYEETDRMVRLAESIVIRTSHPLFNEKMD